MKQYIRNEQFQIEVLDKLNSFRLLEQLVLGGSSMLRLCYGLNRFSHDLHFWLVKKNGNGNSNGHGNGHDADAVCHALLHKLIELYPCRKLCDTESMFGLEVSTAEHTERFRFYVHKENGDSPRMSGTVPMKREQTIAYSVYAHKQVLVQALPLTDVLTLSVVEFLTTRDVQTAFDIEFMVTKGIRLAVSRDVLHELYTALNSLTDNDFLMLIPLLKKGERDYYLESRLRILSAVVEEELSRARE